MDLPVHLGSMKTISKAKAIVVQRESHVGSGHSCLGFPIMTYCCPPCLQVLVLQVAQWHGHLKL